MNSDDVYTPNALEILTKYIRLNPNNDFIFGSVKKHWEFNMDINHIKFIGVGDFIQVIQPDFLLKMKLQKKLVCII